MVTLPLTAHMVIRQATADDLPALEWDGELRHFRRIFTDAYRLMQSGDVKIWIAELPGVGLIGQLFVHLYYQIAGQGNGGYPPERRSSMRSGDLRAPGSHLRSEFLLSAGDRPYAYIYGFRIQAAFRGRGLGSRVLQNVELDLAQRGFHRVTLNVAQDNFGARRLYERLGYRIVAPEPGIWSYLDEDGQRRHVNEPAWRMEKEI